MQLGFCEVCALREESKKKKINIHTHFQWSVCTPLTLLSIFLHGAQQNTRVYAARYTVLHMKVWVTHMLTEMFNTNTGQMECEKDWEVTGNRTQVAGLSRQCSNH